MSRRDMLITQDHEGDTWFEYGSWMTLTSGIPMQVWVNLSLIRCCRAVPH
jgi:hypothetical protein